MHSGLYIVVLRNEEPIPVNCGDARIESRRIRVTRDHCKFGKTNDFGCRHLAYERVFGAATVDFAPLFALEDIARAERTVLVELAPWRLRGRSGRRNEWLGGFSAEAAWSASRAAHSSARELPST